jgi:hypothetical protein
LTQKIPAMPSQGRLDHMRSVAALMPLVSFPDFPVQIMARLAWCCGLPAPDGYQSMFALIATSRIVNTRLGAIFKEQGISEAKMSALVTLLAFDPEPVNQADLTEAAPAGHAAMADALDALVGDGLTVRQPAPKGRELRLTPDGLIFARHIMLPMFMALHDCAATLTPKERYRLAQACAGICACFPASA